MDETFLQNAGLTQVEAKVYLTVLDQGSALAGKITQGSGIQRRTVYDALNRLIEKGLVSYIKTNNRTYFQAADPKRLLEITEEKTQKIRELMPQLELAFNMAKVKQETVFFRGKQGLKTVFDDQLNSKGEILVFGASTYAYEIVKFYFEKYDKERQKKKIFVRAIFNDRLRHEIPYAEVRYLPKEYESHTATNIYGSKVAIILWTQNPFAIVINNEEIAKSYRKYFELMWRIAKH